MASPHVGWAFRRDRRFQHVVTATRPLACLIYLVATTTAVVATADHFALTQSPVSCWFCSPGWVPAPAFVACSRPVRRDRGFVTTDRG
jgi:hypothetical protein